MPQKHSIKKYVKEGLYHIYNRGVEKRKIFMNDQDYRVFLHLLKYYLSGNSEEKAHPIVAESDIKIIRPRPLENLENQIDLICYCLMPNHFHLLVQQHTQTGIQTLMRKIGTIYAMYFNKKYERVGHLFQGTYKAALIETDEYLVHLSKYIHLNPLGLARSHPVNYGYSSCKYFINRNSPSWLKPEKILSYFANKQIDISLNKYHSYKVFLEDFDELEKSKDSINGLILE